MRCILSSVTRAATLAAVTLFGTVAAHAQAPGTPAPAYLGRYITTPADVQAIEQVTQDFRAALITKDAKKLSALLLNNRILFTSPASPAGVRKRRDTVDANADGVAYGGAQDFMNFIAGSKAPVEERFYNIRITQDGHVAWVLFDFDFLENGKVENHGIEVWQMLKTADERWKILSVVWTSHGAPK